MVDFINWKSLWLIFVLAFSTLILTAQEDKSACVKSRKFHLVILGSSTAAGTGPTSKDSAWVNRYRRYVQGINPKNRVTNLAIGGTTTYHIMPDSNQAPSNRPKTNPNNNISQALRLNADAIVVNMPSNDGSKGYSITETMNNFRVIKQKADSANIPIWICTTQPKTTSNTVLIQTQVYTRDSIIAAFAPQVIDFWTTIASSANIIEPKYNSGDNTHLNNAAHKLLFERVKAIQILESIYKPRPIYTLNIFDVYNTTPHECGLDSNIWNVVYGNADTLGSGYKDTIEMQITKRLNGVPTVFTVRDTNNSVDPCKIDTVQLVVNTSLEGEYTLHTELSNRSVVKLGVYRDTTYFKSIGWPELSVTNDTNCAGKQFYLKATSQNDNKIEWFSTTGQKLNTGFNFLTPKLNKSELFLVKATRGPLYFEKSIETSSQADVHWNGIMFNIVAHTNLILDSVMAVFNTTGNQQVNVWFKNGSYKGSENTIADWTNGGNTTVNVTNSGDKAAVSLMGKSIAAGDTLGVYLHLNSASGKLSYDRITREKEYKNTELSLLTGTGISHQFVGKYFPRNWAGKVFYHFGNRPNGACQTNTKAIAVVKNEEVNLGKDTSITSIDNLVLGAPPHFVDYLWSNGSTNGFLIVDSSKYAVGTHKIWVRGYTADSCMGTDTILVTITKSTVGLNNKSISSGIKVFPNPSKGKVNISSAFEAINRVEVYSLQGQLVKQLNEINAPRIDFELAKGFYMVRVKTSQSETLQQLVISD